MSFNIGTELASLLNNSATSGVATTVLNQLGSQLTVSHQTATTVGALLGQLASNPGNAGTLVAMIIAQNPPAGVMAYVNEAAQFAAAAAAPNATPADKAPFVNAVVQAQAALQAAASQGTLGSILSAL